MAEKNETSTAPQARRYHHDAEGRADQLFFNHSGTETYRDKLLKMILADKREKSGKPHILTRKAQAGKDYLNGVMNGKTTIPTRAAG